MRTDPKNTAYEVVSGGKKRDQGPDHPEGTFAAAGTNGGDSTILTDKEREELRKNAFAKLERTISDREQLKMSSERIDGLLDLSQRQWADPYAQNQKLRKAFRVGRKEREKEASRTEDLRDRMSLGIELLPASEDDARRAAAVDFMPGEDALGGGGGGGSAALTKPLFASTRNGASVSNNKDREGLPVLATTTTTTTTTKRTAIPKAEREAARRKGDFVSHVIGNTRLVRDPFLNDLDGIWGTTSSTSANGAAVVENNKVGSTRFLGVKRKREKNDDEKDDTDNGKKDKVDDGNGGDDATPIAKVKVSSTQTVLKGLVNYDSD